MADTTRKVFIEIDAGDQGAVKAFKSVDAAADKTAATVIKVEVALNKTEAAMRKSQAGAMGLSGMFSKMAGATFLGVSAANAFSASLNAVGSVIGIGLGLTQQAIAMSVKYTNAFAGLNSVVSASGQSQAIATEAAKSLAKDGLMSVSEAAEGLKNLLSKGMNIDQATQMMKSLKDTAAFGRQGMLELGNAVVGATQGIRNGMSAMSDNAGVAKNLSQVYKDAGMKAEDLGAKFKTTAEAQKFLNQWMKDNAAQTGDAVKLTETYHGQLSKMKTTWNDLLAVMGDAITKNQTVRDVLGMVSDALLEVSGKAQDNRKAFDWVSGAVINAVKASAELIRALSYTSSAIIEVIGVSSRWGAALINVGGLLVGAAKAALELAQATDPKHQGLVAAGIERLNGVLDAGKVSYEALIGISDKYQGVQTTVNQTLMGYAVTLDGVAAKLETTRGKVVELGVSETRRLATQAAAVALTKEQIKAQKDYAEATAAAMDMLRDSISGIDKMLSKSQDAEEEYWKEWAADARAGAEEVREAILKIEAAMHKVIDTSQAADRDWANWLGERQLEAEGARIAAEQAKKFSTIFSANMQAALSDVGRIIVGTIIQGGGWTKAATAIASRLGSAVGKSIGTYFGGPLGGAIGEAVGSLAGPVLGKVIGLFTGPSIEADITKRVKKSWGVAISEGLSQAIADAARTQTQGNRQAAELLSLDKILGEAGGLNAGNLAVMTGKLRDVFVMFQTGALTAAQATDVLNKNWQAFAKAHTDSSGRISQQMKDLIQLSRDLGLEVQAISDYLWDQAKVAIEGSNAIIGSITNQAKAWSDRRQEITETQKEIDKLNETEAKGRGVEWTRDMAKEQAKLTELLKQQHAAGRGASAELANLGAIAVATYAAAIASGMSFASAIKAASPGLTQLDKAYRDLGINVEDSGLKMLLAMNRMHTQNPSLMAGIDGLSQSFIALSNMGMLNVDTFKRMESAGMTMYGRLQDEAHAAGLTGQDAIRASLMPMQEYLRKAEEQAALLGIPLDANTQMLIDQSKELGIWKDKGKSANDLMLEGLEKIVEQFREMVGLMREAAGIRIPPPPGPGTGTGGTGGGGGNGENGGGPTMHTGGLVTGRGNVNITAQAGEYVVSRQGVAATGLDTMDAINRGTPGPGNRSSGGATNTTQPTGPASAPVVVVINNTKDKPLTPEEIASIACKAVGENIPRNGFDLRTIIVDAVAV